jgi:hypothetical protein
VGLGDLVPEVRAVRHLTKWALAKLAGRSWQDLPNGHLARGVEHESWDDQVTGLADMRFGLTPQNRPTCPQCAVLLDQALENGEGAP